MQSLSPSLSLPASASASLVSFFLHFCAVNWAERNLKVEFERTLPERIERIETETERTERTGEEHS